MNRYLIWIRALNAPCEQVAALASKAMDTELTRVERFTVRLHLLYCSACRRYRRQIHKLRAAMRLWGRRLQQDGSLAAVSPATPRRPLPGLSAVARNRIRAAISTRDA